jgi:hypothetical protein
MSTTTNDRELSPEQAQQVFQELVDQYRTKALWFLKPTLSVDIMDPHAGRILDSIAQRSDRAAWLTVRKLKKWRSRHIS